MTPYFGLKNSSQHQTSTSLLRFVRKNWATPPFPRSRLRFSTSTPKPRAEGSSPSAPAKTRVPRSCENRMVWGFFVLKLVWIRSSFPGLCCIRCRPLASVRNRFLPFSSPLAPKTHPVSPFSGFSGCVFLFFAVFRPQNFCSGFCASCRIAVTG